MAWIIPTGDLDHILNRILTPAGAHAGGFDSNFILGSHNRP